MDREESIHALLDQIDKVGNYKTKDGQVIKVRNIQLADSLLQEAAISSTGQLWFRRYSMGQWSTWEIGDHAVVAAEKEESIRRTLEKRNGLSESHSWAYGDHESDGSSTLENPEEASWRRSLDDSLHTWRTATLGLCVIFLILGGVSFFVGVVFLATSTQSVMVGVLLLGQGAAVFLITCAVGTLILSLEKIIENTSKDDQPLP